MLVMLKKDAPVSEIERIKSFAGSKGLRVDESYGEDFIVLGFLGNTASVDPNDLKASPWVENVQRISAPYKQTAYSRGRNIHNDKVQPKDNKGKPRQMEGDNKHRALRRG